MKKACFQPFTGSEPDHLPHRQYLPQIGDVPTAPLIPRVAVRHVAGCAEAGEVVRIGFPAWIDGYGDNVVDDDRRGAAGLAGRLRRPLRFHGLTGIGGIGAAEELNAEDLHRVTGGYKWTN